jgi:hypothetical protein
MSNVTNLVTPVKKDHYEVVTIIAGDSYIKLKALLNEGWDLIDVISVDGVEGLHASETTFILYKV